MAFKELKYSFKLPMLKSLFLSITESSHTLCQHRLSLYIKKIYKPAITIKSY